MPTRLVLSALLICGVPDVIFAEDAQPSEPVPLAAGTKAGQTWKGNALKMEFCWCPDGSFKMGSPKDEPERNEDEDQVEVTLSGFWMGKFEVTQSEWTAIMGTTLREQQRMAEKKDLSGEGPTHPMYYVNYDEATDFVRELTRRERAAGRLPAQWEYALPTEAQWEYACRAGTRTATWFGDKLSSKQANFYGAVPYNGAREESYPDRTSPVGAYPANSWGLHDMHGNVFEWCRGYYSENLKGGTNPEVSRGSDHISRGGSWDVEGASCRSAFRGHPIGGVRVDELGFRACLVRRQ